MTDGFRKKYQGNNEEKNATSAVNAVAINTVAINSDIPEFNLGKDLFNFGAETENTWKITGLQIFTRKNPHPTLAIMILTSILSIYHLFPLNQRVTLTATLLLMSLPPQCK